jgi:hypothetical protein
VGVADFFRGFFQKKEAEPFIMEPKICETCEILKMELAKAQEREKRLLDKILDVPKVEDAPPRTPIPIPRNQLPWSARKQILEEEDRQRARAMREAPKPIEAKGQTVEELEKELGVENASGTGNR